MTSTLSAKAQAIVDAADAVLDNDDATIPWTAAWVAARMTRDLAYRRVPGDDGCCGGQMCYHYVAAPTRKVKGPDALAPTGRVTHLNDGIMGRKKYVV